jgi:hypothetical protein
MSKYVVVVYKEVGKEPEFRKIENSIEEFEKLVGGEITTIHFEDIEIVYKKDSDNLRPNIYIRPEFLSIGLSIRGNLFVINKNDDSFSTLNKDQAIKYREMLIRSSFNYENFDEFGRYVPNKKRNQRKKRNYDLMATNSKESVKPKYPDVITNKVKTGDPIVDNLTSIPGIKLVAVNEEQDKKDTTKTSENEKCRENLSKESNNPNELNHRGKLVLERTIDDNNTTSDDEDDCFNEVDLEIVLKMILDMQGTILRFIKTITG